MAGTRLSLYKLVLLQFLATVSSGQNITVDFESKLTWKETVSKAKETNKLIFIDVAATWCIPCSKMDKEVYGNDSVAREINRNFISYKLLTDKLDSSGSDANWRTLVDKYRVSEFPTYLFFSRQGKLLYKITGFKDVSQFLGLVASVVGSEHSNFYSLLDDYLNGNLDYSKMPDLAEQAKKMNEKDLAKQIAADYLNNYLYKRQRVDLFKPENLVFISKYMSSSREIGFQIFYKKAKGIDRILNCRSCAENTYETVIINEEYVPIANNISRTNSDPDWNIIRENLAKKYPDRVTDRVLIKSQISWYNYRLSDGKQKSKDWAKGILTVVDFKKIKSYRLDTLLNPMALGNVIEAAVVPYAIDSELLQLAIPWMERVMRFIPGVFYSYDYAALLYRVGDSASAKRWQEMYLNLLRYDSISKNTKPEKNKTYQYQLAVYERMLKGEKIWPLGE